MKLLVKDCLRAGRQSGQGAGAVFYCPKTGRMLFVLRSDEGDWPGVWCGLGGGVEQGETLEQALRREVHEEGGYTDHFPLVHMNSDRQDDDFVFHNYWGIVNEEFVPILNHEHTGYQWTNEVPKPVHPGLERSIQTFKDRVNGTI